MAESVIAAPARVANPERTRLDILEALERGEINADDALRLLRRLEIKPPRRAITRGSRRPLPRR